jgi:hypothetical protein
MFWIIGGAALLIITALWFTGRPPHATVTPYTFLGDTYWRWECGADFGDGYDNKSAAILAAEKAGYWVEQGR